LIGTLPGDRQTVPEPLPLQDCCAADAVGAAAIATVAAPAANSDVMYRSFIPMVVLLEVLGYV
jgi:hypothetical protein